MQRGWWRMSTALLRNIWIIAEVRSQALYIRNAHKVSQCSPLWPAEPIFLSRARQQQGAEIDSNQCFCRELNMPAVEGKRKPDVITGMNHMFSEQVHSIWTPAFLIRCRAKGGGGVLCCALPAAPHTVLLHFALISYIISLNLSISKYTSLLLFFTLLLTCWCADVFAPWGLPLYSEYTCHVRTRSDSPTGFMLICWMSMAGSLHLCFFISHNEGRNEGSI